MKSIIQEDSNSCYLCGMNGNLEPLDKHHVFGGPNRGKSEKYGLFVYLHHKKCHIFGKNAVHSNEDVSKELKAHAQGIAMEKYDWSKDKFIDVFGKSYI